MKYLFLLSLIVSLLGACKKNAIRPNPDLSIRINTYYGINKITSDTIFAFYIPTGFTPNGDGINEYWEPISLGLDSSKYHIDILDKSGKIIFKSDTPVKFDGMDKSGRILPQQALCFFIEVKDKLNNSYRHKGQFVLIR